MDDVGAWVQIACPRYDQTLDEVGCEGGGLLKRTENFPYNRIWIPKKRSIRGFLMKFNISILLNKS